MAQVKCPECTQDVRVTRAGALYRHSDCPGGGRPAAKRDTATPAVYLVRPGRRNEELRYSLRSLANARIDQVILVGAKPDWLDGVEHIPTRQLDRAEKSNNVRRGYEAIVDKGPDEFVLFNDDFFVMKPTTIGPTHRGNLADVLRNVRPTGYYKGLVQVAALLNNPQALAYDAVHTPQPMTRDALGMALDLFDGIHGIRTIAGNLLGYGGTKVPNAKNPEPHHWDDMAFLSTSDKSFKYRDIGAYIRRRFRQPSRWEVQ